MMRILCYRHSYDQNFESILGVISKIKTQIGYASGEINQENLISFSPDIIIHNIPDAETFPIKSNAVSININETKNKNSFSFNDKSSSNYIGEFVHLRESTIDDSEIEKFSSDVLYIGTPSVFGTLLEYILNSDINFKFFNHQPHNISGYCGMCNIQDYYKFYKHAKVCIAQKDDKLRIMDIVAAGGNPVIYDGSNTEDCIEKITNAISNNQKYAIEGYTKEDIISKDTSYDRVAKIFKTIGLNKLADEVIRNKKIDWYKK